MPNSRPALLLCFVVLGASALVAQGGPAPFSLSVEGLQPLAQVPLQAVAALDRQAIAAQDEIADANRGALRYAIPSAVQWDPANHGVWESLSSGVDVWRLRVHAPGASHLNLGFGTFDLPAGAHVQVFDVTGNHVVRRFTDADNNSAQQLWTPVVQGDEVAIELVVPQALRPRAQLAVTHVGSGYRYFGAGATALGGTDGGSCNVDVACPQGAAWAMEIPSVAAISTGGFVFCSGFMVNNTAQDGRPFFMTAYHCGVGGGSASSLVAYWNYQNTTCSGSGANFNQFSTGAVLRAEWSTSDFTLVEFNSAPNPAWGVTYSGWDATGQNASSAVAIHHPSGCEKKISFENQPTTMTSYLGSNPSPTGTHVRVADWDTGTTEGGSSGSPLFNQNHQVIGQLHGGFAACGNNAADWYGRFDRSWTGGGSNSTRLSNWLDPLGTGALTWPTLGGVQPGLFVTYGQGCLGGSLSTGACGQVNGGGGTLSGLSDTAEYAFKVTNSGTVQIAGCEFFTQRVGGAGSVIVNLYLDQGGQPAAISSRAGLLVPGAAPGLYATMFGAPLIVTGDYYVSFGQTAASALVPNLTSGAGGTVLRRPALLSGVWGPAPQVTAPSFRVRCTPIANVPVIANQGVARINQSFSVTLADANPSSVALLFIGFSKTTWPGGALPAPLPSAPGCDVLMSADDWSLATSSATGTGSVGFSIPNTASLVGIDVHHQWFVADPSANGLGVAVSQGATSTIGG